MVTKELKGIIRLYTCEYFIKIPQTEIVKKNQPFSTSYNFRVVKNVCLWVRKI